MPNSTSKNTPHGITNIDNIIKFEGWAWSQQIAQWIPLPYATSAGSNQLNLRANVTNIIVGAGDDKSNYTKAYVTLYYTKSS